MFEQKPTLEHAYERRIKAAADAIEKHIYTKLDDLKVTAWLTEEPVSYNNRKNGEMTELSVGDNWGGLFDCAWMNFSGSIPKGYPKEDIVLLIDVSGEAYVVNDKGEPVQGLTTVSSLYDFRLGFPGKKVVYLDELAKGDSIDIWADAGNNDLFGEFKNRGNLVEASISLMNREIKALHFDYEVLDDLRKRLPKKTSRYIRITDALYRASHEMKDFTETEAFKARKILKVELDRKNADYPLSVTAIGHSHIDLAWLWPIRETKRKAARTLSTVFKHMENYPEFIFGASQPQLYQWVKDLYPSLYKKIHKAYEEGRWELQGAMWVEADTNVSGGEALIRQVLYGKKFYKDEFGFNVRNLWLPDVFGYSAALPQILKKSGVDYFMTTKIAWNETNDFPHHTYIWRGLDGSEVLAHMPPEGTYNSSGAPRAVIEAEEKFHDKDKSDECLLLFGIGDGGGGPGEEHLERMAREKNLQGMAPVKQGFASDLFERLAKDIENYDTWNGELYLEFHRGTYTSEARNKKYNKILENLLRLTEIIHVIKGIDYPFETLDRIWKEVLLYQFHDILPGSSIKRVYDESVQRYKLLEKELELLLADSKGSENISLFNQLSWERNGWLKYNDEWLFCADAKPLSFAGFDNKAVLACKVEVNSDERTISNQNYTAKFNENGELISFFGKDSISETVPVGKPANVFSVYRDTGDAWDFPFDYRDMELEKPILSNMSFVTDGPEAKMISEYTFRNSVISQEAVLADSSKRLEFRTRIDWNDKNTMLRSCFPLDFETDDITCGIQFGYLKRPSHDNNSWDKAKFEVCAHNYVDKSRMDRGVAVLSDYKYGYSSTLDSIEINLIRSTTFPDTEGDIGTHEFAYALYPHESDHIKGNVIKEALEFVNPLYPIGKPDSIPVDEPFVTVTNDNVIVETIKMSEDDTGKIIRFYEAYGDSSDTAITFNRKYKTISSVNLIEQEKETVGENTDSLIVKFTPFEIKTFILE